LWHFRTLNIKREKAICFISLYLSIRYANYKGLAHILLINVNMRERKKMRKTLTGKSHLAEFAANGDAEAD